MKAQSTTRGLGRKGANDTSGKQLLPRSEWEEWQGRTWASSKMLARASKWKLRRHKLIKMPLGCVLNFQGEQFHTVLALLSTDFL
jgi:hypothetical protein